MGELPAERRAILAWVLRAGRETPPGARVLDAGAGDSPYRELFGHCEYVTSDWSHSPHEGAAGADIVAPLDTLPVADGSFDVVLSTQVLEHVPDPAGVLVELGRVLTPGGTLWLSAPMVGEMHEEPYDFYRYTRHGLAELLARAGYVEVETAPLGGYFTALAALCTNGGTAIDAVTPGARLAAAGLRLAGRLLPALDRLDRRHALPVGWGVRARRPG